MDRLRRADSRRRDRTPVAVLAAVVLVGLTACEAATGGPSDSTALDMPPPAVTTPVAAAPTPPVATAPVATAPATTAPPVVEPAPTSDPAVPPVWQNLFVDHFDGPAGTPAGQWHTMTGWKDALLDGNGRLEVGRLAQIRSTSGWVLPAGTRVRVSASLIMPDTSTNYAAIWVQHPNPADPREIDVIESYGPKKTGGAQLGSHLCYDETLDNAVDECGEAGLAPELWPVAKDFADGAKPWDASWEYHAEFTVGGDQVLFQAEDGSGHRAYSVTSNPDPRRVPGNAVPFHLRLSNKDVDPEHALLGGSRHSMYVDWVVVEVMDPTAAAAG